MLIRLVIYHDTTWKEQRYPALQVALTPDLDGNAAKEDQESMVTLWNKIATDSEYFVSGSRKIPKWTGSYLVLNSSYIEGKEESGFIFDDESFDDEWISTVVAKFTELIKLIHEGLESSPVPPVSSD